MQGTKSYLGLFSLAKKDGFFHLEWDGLKELDKLFEEMDENFERILLEEYTEYGMLVEEGAKALVHHDEGDLEDSIVFDKAKRDGSGVSVEGGSNMVYALRRHEEPYRPGTHPKYNRGAKFERYYLNGRGRGTITKSKWRGFKPGRKFLENAIKATEKDYDEMNARILDRTLGGDS